MAIFKHTLAGRLATFALAVITTMACVGQAHAQEIARKVQNKVAPTYPEIARKMRISGTVKLLVVVASNGTVKSTTVVGGNPVLVNAATDAVKKWKYEPAPQPSTGVVEFRFAPE